MKRKYRTAAERKAAKLEQTRVANKRWRAKNRKPRVRVWLHEPGPAEVTRPPAEVIAERDFRLELISAMSAGDQVTSTPRAEYAAQYYVQAWRTQRRFARGR